MVQKSTVLDRAILKFSDKKTFKKRLQIIAIVTPVNQPINFYIILKKVFTTEFKQSQQFH